MIPALRDAAKDTAIRGASLAVYVHLLFELDTVQLRDVKQTALARDLEYSERQIRKSLHVLVRRGYLRPGRVRPGATRRYRLVYSRAHGSTAL